MEMQVSKEYMMTDLNKNVTRDGRPFIKAVMVDEEGTQYNSIMFDSNKLDFEPEVGLIVHVEGGLQQYAGQTQLKINMMRLCEGADPSDFLPRSGLDAEAMLEELKRIVYEYVKTDYLTAFLDKFFADEELMERFMKSPAAKSVHHAYINGLLEHTLSVTKIAVMMGRYYKNKANIEHLIFGALFHDIGKIYELKTAPGFDYTDSGKLMGHLIQGIQLFRSIADGIDNFPDDVKDLVSHLVASHHGYLEFGSPQVPKTVEAMILHHIDDIDAKMNTFYSIFNKEEVEEGWTSYDRLLERQLFRHPYRSGGER
ncbi:3'-5' exoribonuclease YhaM family protein [Limisalsivibrio acetivorans]|uniref:3'-5' exoribonuclease YhaM family protein n=1 Tax=Limisalsivibrio acetivorans TaxID=1304888 RepID=UPI0003B5B9B5|nr:HD domain-containing protein [Limisalsivibrio acetivorans]